MKRHNFVVFGIAAALICAALAWRYVPGLWPAFGPAAPIPSATPDASPAATASGPLTAQEGLTASLLTDDVPGARDLLLERPGVFWVSQTESGMVTRFRYGDEPALAENLATAFQFSGLDKPHGLAILYGESVGDEHLYIAELTRVSRVKISGLSGASGGPQSLEKIAELPAGGRHVTRSLAFGADGRLYVSIGSSCDVCNEVNPEHGSIISMNPDGSDRKIVASGLRNAVFLVPNPSQRSELWATEMGRDHLGDSLPPDEVNVLDTTGPVRNYGWPICYGNRVHDTKFDTNQYIRDPCADTAPPLLELPAHVAPLGLAFHPDGDLLIAYHGSWNSSVPVGYKVARWHRNGNSWTATDFLTGFLKGGSALGRPVDVLLMPEGSVLVSDDKAGAIWRVGLAP